MKIDNWLTFEDTNKGFQNIETEPLNYYSDVFTPWQTKQRLKIWREVEWNLSGWWKVKTWYSSIPSWYTNFAITWVWFTPKAIQVVVQSSNKVAWGYADNVWWTLTQRCIYADWWNYSNQTTRLFRFSGTEVWDLVSLDSDWFTVRSDLSATMIWTCFW
jgi:hypothetical protein